MSVEIQTEYGTCAVGVFGPPAPIFREGDTLEDVLASVNRTDSFMTVAVSREFVIIDDKKFVGQLKQESWIHETGSEL